MSIIIYFRKLLFIIIIIFSIYYIQKIPPKEKDNDNEIKIMCMGDSITQGQKNSGSYRKYLYHNLISKGYNIKMVGSKDQRIQKYYDKKTNEEILYQDDNCGYSAYTICEYKNRKGLLEKLDEKKSLQLNPDIILLLIGTNNIMENFDFDTTLKDFVMLIDYIFDNMPQKAILFVATIPDMNPNNENVYNWFNKYRESEDGKIKYDDKEVQKNVSKNVQKYNEEITKLVNHFQSRKLNVRLENLNSVLKNTDKLLIDGVHPNEKGYEKMGQFWTEIIEKYLKEKKKEKEKEKEIK